jgi:hypothetical protein
MFGTTFLGTVLAVFLILGAVRGDAERGLLQPLVVRPLDRWQLLLGRFAGAAGVCASYVLVLYALTVVIVNVTGHRSPDRVIGPGLALAGAVTIHVALSLLGSVLYQAGLHGADQTGFNGVLVNLGPFGSSHAAARCSTSGRSCTPGLVAGLAMVGFARRDL